jgi:hypothetical protein
LALAFFVVLANIVFFPFLWQDRSMMSSSKDAASLNFTGAYPFAKTSDPGKVLDAGAPAWVTEPEFRLMHDQIFHEHVVPLWNPFEAFGDPLLASMQAQPFYPPAWLVIAHPTPRAYSIFIIVRLLLAGFFAFLFLRFFVGFTAALAGGVCCMLMGYFVLYYDMPEVSVESTISMLFFAVELHVRRRSWYSALTLAFAVWLVIMGGMPESSLLLVGLGGSYAVLRVAMQRNRLTALCHVALAGMLGAVCSALFVLPSIEFIRNSTNAHEVRFTGYALGLGSDPWLPQYLISYLSPLTFGPPWNSILGKFSGFSGVRGYFGVIPLFFSCAAVIGSFLDRRDETKRVHNAVTAFFAFATLFFLGKHFGVPIVNSLGALPLFDEVSFPKYEEVLIGFSVAMLVGLGFDRLFAGAGAGAGAGARRVAQIAATCTFAIVTSTVLWALTIMNHIATMFIYFWFGCASLAAFLVVVLAVTVLLHRGWVRPRTLGYAALGSLCFEMSCNYLIPMFYVATSEPPNWRNAYAGAPYVRYLQAAMSHQERLLGLDAMLYPNWASAFGLQDVRGLDALFYKRYFAFLSAFLPKDSRFPDEFENRFTGQTAFYPSSMLAQRFLSLSSVSYIVTSKYFIEPHSITGMIVSQNLHKIPQERQPQFITGYFDLAGEKRAGFLEHPPFSRLPVRIDVPKRDAKLSFGIGFDPETYAGPPCGGGVHYVLEVRDGSTIRQVFNAYIDPKHVVAQRRWLQRSVDLSSYSGRSIELLFSTFPGAQGTCMAWSLWSDPHFAASPRPSSLPFKPVYADEAYVYRFEDPLPRATIYYAVHVVTAETALAALRAPAFDIHRSAVVEIPSSEHLSVAAQSPAGEPPVGADAAQIVSYRSQEVVVRANARRPGLLVLNDTDYPGWRAFLDGKPVAIVAANYLFRGVFVPPGEHKVTFRYQPQSWLVGIWITLVGMICLAAYAILLARSGKSMDENQVGV